MEQRGGSTNAGTSRYHPCLSDFRWTKPSSVFGVPPWLWNPPNGFSYIILNDYGKLNRLLSVILQKFTTVLDNFYHTTIQIHSTNSEWGSFSPGLHGQSLMDAWKTEKQFLAGQVGISTCLLIKEEWETQITWNSMRQTESGSKSRVIWSIWSPEIGISIIRHMKKYDPLINPHMYRLKPISPLQLGCYPSDQVPQLVCLEQKCDASQCPPDRHIHKMANMAILRQLIMIHDGLIIRSIAYVCCNMLTWMVPYVKILIILVFINHISTYYILYHIMITIYDILQYITYMVHIMI